MAAFFRRSLIGADGYASVRGVRRIITEKERQKHDERRGKRNTGYLVDRLRQKYLIGRFYNLFVLKTKITRRYIYISASNTPETLGSWA